MNSEHPQSCSSCKHFVYRSDLAHQNRCGKFVKDGIPIACAEARPAEEHCDDGKAWESV